MTKQKQSQSEHVQNTVVEAAEHAEAGRQLTADTITASIYAAMHHVQTAFTLLETRQLADNGKVYPIDASLPDGVHATDQTVDVNRYRYVETRMLQTVVWKLENLLAEQDERIDSQRRRIAESARQISSGRVTEAMVDRMADFLEDMTEQRQVIAVAFAAAKESYETQTGLAYETKGEREDRARAEKKAKADDPRLARLRALGVAV